jgi:hypothetical protein
MSDEQSQRATCERYDATFTLAGEWINSGFASQTSERRPIHGLRHPPTVDTTGWFIWCGEYSDANDFFKPIHTIHVTEMLPEIGSLLGLPAGYRFLVAQDHIDVWFDKALLTV